MKLNYPLNYLYLLTIGLTLAEESLPQLVTQEPPAIVDIKNFVVPDDLEITVWAKSPMFYNPTNMDIDHLGRIWVAEGLNYRKSQLNEKGDRIVILSDTNKDGVADDSQVFVQDKDLESPLGIAVFDNVVVVSQPPNLIQYTDVNRDSKFDPKIDKKDIILTGFEARQHDHSLHSLTAGPDGKWYFNNGNCGAVFTDKSGKTFYVQGPYKGGGGVWYNPIRKYLGKASDDGHVWTPGFTVRMNPDGTDVEIVGHGYRNSYEQTLNSYGEMFQNDNDDPPACRNSYVLEYGSAGYFTRDGRNYYHRVSRPGQDRGRAHWRQDDPGTFDVGDIYGIGSPTGVVYYENGALGDDWIGTYLSCEAGQNVIFSYQPEQKGAGYIMERSEFATSNPTKEFAGVDAQKGGGVGVQEFTGDINPVKFRPSDISVGVDGALYVADWLDGRVGGHQTDDELGAGAIYRIAPKGFKPSIPQVDATTIADQIELLKSPAVNVRYLGFKALKAGGEKSYDAVAALLNDSNPYIAARAIWLLPYLGEQGLMKCEELLKHENANIRMTSYRALRRINDNANMIPYAQQLAGDSSAAVRKDVALSMRHYSAEQAAPILIEIAQQYSEAETYDKNYVEAIGLGSANKEGSIWLAMKKAMVTGDALSWTPEFARLTWRLWTAEAIEDLKTRTLSAELTQQQREFAIESLAFIDDMKAAEAMIKLAKQESDMNQQVLYWLDKNMTANWSSFQLPAKLAAAGIKRPKPAPIRSITVPEPPATPAYTVEDVLALTGDAVKGKQTIMRCVICHHINGVGPYYGPALDGWGKTQSRQVIIDSIVNPSSSIAHGYKGNVITLEDGTVIHGIIRARANPVVVQSTGGIEQKIPKKSIKTQPFLDRSLMLSGEQLGLTAQDVADITAYMQQPTQ